MIKNSPIVEDTRRVRRQISAKFNHDIGRYIAYLQSESVRREKREVQSTLSKPQYQQPNTNS
ncbi:MAG: hypothetical protein OXM61_12705 [Candidatus Poribacteria bacterium]|nr:hypothetical protein [Candidatus Poribacteria bacterium]